RWRRIGKLRISSTTSRRAGPCWPARPNAASVRTWYRPIAPGVRISHLDTGSRATAMHSKNLFFEEMLFAQGIRAGEFAFTAQDGREPSGELNETSAQDQALRTVENLGLALKTAELDLGSVVSLMVYLSEYSDGAQVAQVLAATFGTRPESCPATTLVGVA